MTTLMERVVALEEVIGRLGVTLVPPGHVLVFWTEKAVSQEAASNLAAYCKSRGVEAILVSGVQGCYVQERVNEAGKT